MIALRLDALPRGSAGRAARPSSRVDGEQRARRVGGVHDQVGVEEEVHAVGERHEENVARVVDDEAPDRLDERERRAARRRGRLAANPSP